MKSVLWVIDGNNVIRRHPQLAALEREGGFAAACAFLESALSRFRARQGRGHSVVVAYDGQPAPGTGRAGGKGLRVRYPPRGGDADQVVLEEVRRAEGRMEVHVVSSDRQDITGRLRGMRVRIHGVREFFDELGPVVDAGPPEPEKPEPPRGTEVDRWLREFGGEEQ